MLWILRSILGIFTQNTNLLHITLKTKVPWHKSSLNILRLMPMHTNVILKPRCVGNKNRYLWQGTFVFMVLCSKFVKNAQNWSAWFSRFSSFGQLTLDMGVFIRSIGSPNCKDIKIATEKGYFQGTWFTPSFLGFGGVDDL